MTTVVSRKPFPNADGREEKKTHKHILNAEIVHVCMQWTVNRLDGFQTVYSHTEKSFCLYVCELAIHTDLLAIVYDVMNII